MGTLILPESTTNFGEPLVVVDSWCAFAGLVFGGLFGFFLTELAEAALEEGMESKFLQMVLALTTSLPTSFDVASVPSTKFHAVTIVPEAMTLGGLMAVPIPAPDPPSVTIHGAVSKLGAPVYVARGDVHIDTYCVKGDFPVMEILMKQIGVYWIATYRIPRPLTSAIMLEAWEGTTISSSTLISSTAVPSSGSGTVALAAENCSYPFPVPDGSVVQQPVHLAYAVDRRTMRFYNMPSEGNFGPVLRVKVTNPAGLDEEVSIDMPFVGNTATIGGTYYEQLAECLVGTLGKVDQYVNPTEMPPWVPGDHPRPDEVLAFVKAMVASGTPELEALAPLVALAHGDTFEVAMQKRPSVPMVQVTSIDS